MNADKKRSSVSAEAKPVDMDQSEDWVNPAPMFAPGHPGYAAQSIADTAEQLAALQERFNLVAAINASYVDEIRALRESIADTAGASSPALQRLFEIQRGYAAKSDAPPAPSVASKPEAYLYEHATYPDDYKRSLSFERTDHSKDFVCRPLVFAPSVADAAGVKYTQADMERYGKCYADARDKRRADAAGASEGDVRDAQRWRYVAGLCFSESNAGGEFIGIMLPRLRETFEGSTEDEFRATVDAALEKDKESE